MFISYIIKDTAETDAKQRANNEIDSLIIIYKMMCIEDLVLRSVLFNVNNG